MELPTLRRLEKCVVALQPGRNQLRDLYVLEREKLLNLAGNKFKIRWTRTD